MATLTRPQDEEIPETFDREPEGVSEDSKYLLQQRRELAENSQSITAIRGYPFRVVGTETVVATVQLHRTLRKLNEFLEQKGSWNGHETLFADPQTVPFAKYWMKLFFADVASLGYGWLEPNVMADADGTIVFEWRRGVKKLQVYVNQDSAEYLKSWGPDVKDEMEDGRIEQPKIGRLLWKWLIS